MVSECNLGTSFLVHIPAELSLGAQPGDPTFTPQLKLQFMPQFKPQEDPPLSLVVNHTGSSANNNAAVISRSYL